MLHFPSDANFIDYHSSIKWTLKKFRKLPMAPERHCGILKATIYQLISPGHFLSAENVPLGSWMQTQLFPVQGKNLQRAEAQKSSYSLSLLSGDSASKEQRQWRWWGWEGVMNGERQLFSEQVRTTKDLDECRALLEDRSETEVESWGLFCSQKEKIWMGEQWKKINSWPL